MRIVRKAVAHLRLYESAQVLVPGLFGLLGQPSTPRFPVLLAYAIAYVSHVLSVYTYNDYCDFTSDLANPRKTAEGTRSRAWLRNQTLLLSSVFLAAALFLPAAVGLLFAAIQVLCMAYSHPRIRLKGRLLGSELAHFAAGAGYFVTGVLVAGGDPADHLPGGLLFGVLYLSGGTFNEIMDCETDREAGLGHLVVVAGKRPVLRGIFAAHYAGLALLAACRPSAPVVIACVVAVPIYAFITRHLVTQVGNPALLLRFRRRYRMMFGALLAILLAASR